MIKRMQWAIGVNLQLQKEYTIITSKGHSSFKSACALRWISSCLLPKVVSKISRPKSWQAGTTLRMWRSRSLARLRTCRSRLKPRSWCLHKATSMPFKWTNWEYVKRLLQQKLSAIRINHRRRSWEPWHNKRNRKSDRMSATRNSTVCTMSISRSSRTSLRCSPKRPQVSLKDATPSRCCLSSTSKRPPFNKVKMARR